MNGSGKQSFYEIQLNNASLIVAFLVAVGLGVAVFMLGVMVGRGQTAGAERESGWVEELGGQEAGSESESMEPEFFEKVQEDDATAPPERETATETTEETTEEATEEATEVASPEPLVTAPADLPANDPSLASGYVVQVEATSDRQAADELQSTLAAAGYPAFVVTGDIDGRAMHRVRVGRYADEDDALRVEAALSEHPAVEQTWVTQG